MKRTLFILLFISLSIFNKAQNQEWTIVSSDISFKIKNAGFTVDGKVGNLTGTIQFDPAKISGNKIEASIDANTINTGNTMRDNHLKKEEYFFVEKFPKISTSASSFTKEADSRFKGNFSLSIKGTTKEVPVVFSYSEQNGKMKLSASFKLNRLDYKVGSTSFIMSDDVNVFIEVTFAKK